MKGSKVEAQGVAGFQCLNENVGAVWVDVGNWHKRRVVLGVFITGGEVAWSVSRSVSMGTLNKSHARRNRGPIKSDVYRQGLGAVYAVVGKVVMPWRRFCGALFFCKRVVVEKLGGITCH